jgi:mono/diheme cytochrome c family protein
MRAGKMKTKALMFVLAIAAGITFSFPGWAQTGVQSAAEKRALFMRGAKLWPVYCNTCHNARPGPEFSPTEWDMIMMHMRTQANLPPQDARAILEYLKSSR